MREDHMFNTINGYSYVDICTNLYKPFKSIKFQLNLDRVKFKKLKEVADTNTAAMNLYKKLGFEEYNRIPVPQKRARKIGINNFIALKYIKC